MTHEWPVTCLFGLSKYSTTSSIAGSNIYRIDFTSIALDTLKKTLHVARQYFIYLCFVAAVWCEMWTFPILMYGKSLANCCSPGKCKHNKCYIIAISMTHRIYDSLYYLIKGNTKIIFKKNCNNPAFCPRYLAPAGVECSWNERNNFICT